MVTFQQLLGDFPQSRFIAEHLHRLPFTLHGTAAAAAPLGSWETLAAMLQSPQLDLMLARDGAHYQDNDPRTLEEIQRLSAEGWTALVRHAERCHGPVAELAAAFENTFHAPVDVHMYFTPAGRFGFSWHYDAEDVFILQTTGEKEYLLRKNTVQPWPLEETLPLDMKYECELMPLARVVLGPGDLLYIPCGYWHRAEATAQSQGAANSLAVGVMSRAAIDLLQWLRPRLVQSILWRQRLPIAGQADLEEHYGLILAALADDISRTLKDPEVIREATRRFAH